MSECPSCGANIDLSPQSKYVTCDFCQSKVANFKSFENVEDLLKKCDDNIEVQHLEQISLSMKLHDYKSVLKSADALVAISPKSWAGYTYKGIANFWLGTDNFSHMRNVLIPLEKAKTLSENNEFVIDALDLVSNNLVIEAVKNEPYGTSFDNACNAINAAKELNGLSEESKKNIEEYFDKFYEFSVKTIKGNLKQKNKDYVPMKNLVHSLGVISFISSQNRIGELFYLTSAIFVDKNETNSFSKSFIIKNKKIKEFLKKNGSNMFENNSFSKVKLEDLAKYLKLKINFGGCFVVTATLNNPEHIIVKELQLFRDTTLINNRLGKLFICKYYQYGPSLANLIIDSKFLKFLSLNVLIKPFYIIAKHFNKKNK